MVSRKRARDEADSTPTVAPPSKEPGILERLRNMWQFANLAQWLYIFGKAVKLDEDFDVEVCLDTQLTLFTLTDAS